MLYRTGLLFGLAAFYAKASEYCLCENPSPCQHVNDDSCVQRVDEAGNYVDEGGVCSPGSFDCGLEKPTYPTKYHAKFNVVLPYVNLVENIEVHMDSENGLQRLSYFDDQDVYIYNSSSPNSFQIVPVVKDRTCFIGRSGEPQTVFPTLIDGFKLKTSTQSVNGVECNQWHLEQPELDEDTGYIGSYTLFSSVEDGTPVAFSFVGHNVIAAGSHYDQYAVDYLEITEVDEFEASVWQPPAELTCVAQELDDDDGGGPTGPTLASPLHDLHMLHPEGAEARGDAFRDFASAHGKKEEYAEQGLSHDEVAGKAANFHQSLRYINSMNRQRLGYTLGVNHMADWTHEERRALNGRQKGVSSPGAKFTHTAKGGHLPDNVDWRDYGAVTAVKDQGTCGSCWSFGTTGTIEGQHFLKHGQLLDLSQQALVDCSWPQGNNACDGGTDVKAYAWIEANGGRVPSRAAYGPYMSQDGYCHVTDDMEAAQFTGYANITSFDFESFNHALATVGPLSISINATPNSFYFYKSGLYADPECKNGENDLDHIVLAVGYVTVDGEKYTVVKNSWSTYWGEDGYVLVKQEGNICGVATAATYALA